MNPTCMCLACIRRRAAQTRWVEKNLARKYAANRAWRKRKRTGEAGILPEVPDLSPEVSDEELDRRALAKPLNARGAA